MHHLPILTFKIELFFQLALLFFSRWPFHHSDLGQDDIFCSFIPMGKPHYQIGVWEALYEPGRNSWLKKTKITGQNADTET